MTASLSMINGIVQLVNMSATGIQGTATAAATAIQTVEKASVILTIISGCHVNSHADCEPVQQ